MLLTMMTCLKQWHYPKEGLVTEFLSSVYSPTTSHNQNLCCLSKPEYNLECVWNVWVRPTSPTSSNSLGKQPAVVGKLMRWGRYRTLCLSQILSFHISVFAPPQIVSCENCTLTVDALECLSLGSNKVGSWEKAGIGKSCSPWLVAIPLAFLRKLFSCEFTLTAYILVWNVTLAWYSVSGVPSVPGRHSSRLESSGRCVQGGKAIPPFLIPSQQEYLATWIRPPSSNSQNPLFLLLLLLRHKKCQVAISRNQAWYHRSAGVKTTGKNSK